MFEFLVHKATEAKEDAAGSDHGWPGEQEVVDEEISDHAAG